MDEAIQEWLIPDGVDWLLDGAAQILDMFIVEPPEEFRDPENQIHELWRTNQEDIIRLMGQEHIKMQYVNRKIGMIRMVRRFYARQGNYMADLANYLIREQQLLRAEQVADGAIAPVPGDVADEIDVGNFFRRMEIDAIADRQRQARRLQREQERQEAQQRRLDQLQQLHVVRDRREAERAQPQEIIEPEVFHQMFGAPGLDRFQQHLVQDLSKECDTYAGLMWRPGKKQKPVRDKPYFIPHSLPQGISRHHLVHHFINREPLSSDANLTAYLKQEAMYLPRTPGLALVLKEKAKRWIEEFDTARITREEQTAIIGNAVNAAMMPTDPEIALVHQQQNLSNKFTVWRHNSYFSTGDKVSPTDLGPLYSSSRRIVTQVTKTGLLLTLIYYTAAKPDVVISLVDTSHVILNHLGTRLQSTMAAYVTRWFPYERGISYLSSLTQRSW